MQQQQKQSTELEIAKLKKEIQEYKRRNKILEKSFNYLVKQVNALPYGQVLQVSVKSHEHDMNISLK
jgi:predicted RNase H-like nuclease (RuvC/YqgF family)